MTALLHFSRAIDGMSLVLGRILPWAVIIAVLVSAGNALSRKFFQVSSNAWLEAQLYLFGVIFLLLYRIHAFEKRPCQGRYPGLETSAARSALDRDPWGRVPDVSGGSADRLVRHSQFSGVFRKR
ncbi:hypothetical protein ABFB10_22590 [Ponticoccus litoralis]|uniref:Uncharacterized protein n=1 Tax=Ponticoccus litoralis TaxID=422297 RepID=A0AAW9SS58_9RHOB